MGPFVTDFVHLDKCSRVKNPVSTSFLLTTEHYSAVGAHHILCIIPFYYSQGPFGRHSWVPILAIYSFIHYLLWSFSVCVHDTHVYICVLVCMHVKARSHVNCYPESLFTSFFETWLLIEPVASPVRVGWMAREFQG